MNWKKTVTRPLSPLKASSLFEGLEVGIDRYVGVPFRSHLLEPAGTGHAWYVLEEEWSAFVAAIRDRAQDLSYIEDVAEEAERVCKALLDVARRISQTNHKRLSLASLLDAFQEYRAVLVSYPFIAWGFLVIDELLSKALLARLNSVLTQLNRTSEADKIAAILTTKTGTIAAEEEELDLLRLKSLAKQVDGPELSSLLEQHAEKYAWLPMYDHNIRPWSKEHFQESMNRLPSNPEEVLQAKLREQAERKETLSQTLSSLRDPELERLSHLMQRFILLRTYRTDVLREVYYLIDPFLSEIVRRMGHGNERISYLTCDEFIEYLESGSRLSSEVLECRMEKYAMLRVDGRTQVVCRERDIHTLLEKHLRLEATSEELKGDGIFPGVVKGRVRILRTGHTESVLEPGEIIVAEMTTPEMHEALSRAGAIVTDEGGITCHAAIVSREMGIPCVIATEIATKVLKDGDLVEVDSNAGVVRRISE